MGVGSNMLQARLATKLAKPDGVALLGLGDHYECTRSNINSSHKEISGMC